MRIGNRQAGGGLGMGNASAALLRARQCACAAMCVCASLVPCLGTNARLGCARQGRRATGTGTAASRKWMPRRALGRGQGEGRTLKRSALCQHRAETPKPNRTGRREGSPPAAHGLQEGRRLHLREVSQAAERKKRARQSSAALLFCRLECWTSLLLRWAVVM